jgi:D-xylose transport system substrate-binding protein
MLVGTPQLAILNGSPTDNNARLFARGYHSILDPLFEAGRWELVAEQDVPDWDNQQALIIFEQMQTNHPGINAAVAANDGLAQAMIAARQNAGLPYMPLTGQDATVGGIQNVLAGRQSMTVYKPIRVLAEAAAAMAVALVRGDNASILVNSVTNNGTRDIPTVLIGVIPITRANLAQTLIVDGFRVWDEICVGEFAQYCPPEALLEGTPDG